MPSRNAFVFAAAAYSLGLAPEARACHCEIRSLCQNIDFASVVLRGDVVRTNPKVPADDDKVTYNIKVIHLYKTEVGVEYPQEIEITASADPARCDIYLEVGEQYLLDLYRYDGELRSVGSCGATQSWVTLNAERIATLADINSACAVDPCAACGEFQDCLLYTQRGSSSTAEEFYCADTCAPGVCGEGEVCSLNEVNCVRAPCPPVAECIAPPAIEEVEEEKDLCEGRCSKYQECLFYSGDFAEDQYYCSATCDPFPCMRGEECSLVPAKCDAGSICPFRFLCSPAAADPDAAEDAVARAIGEDNDPCEGRCEGFQECLFYAGNIAEDQYYCSAVCDPSLCGEGEECHLTPASCAAGSICGNGFLCAAVADATVQKEDPCAPCGKFQDCLVYANGTLAEYYCADLCDPSRCRGEATCSLVDQADCDAETSPCPPVATCASPVELLTETQMEEGGGVVTESVSSALRPCVYGLTVATALAAMLLLGR